MYYGHVNKNNNNKITLKIVWGTFFPALQTSCMFKTNKHNDHIEIKILFL